MFRPVKQHPHGQYHAKELHTASNYKQTCKHFIVGRHEPMEEGVTPLFMGIRASNLTGGLVGSHVGAAGVREGRVLHVVDSIPPIFS